MNIASTNKTFDFIFENFPVDTHKMFSSALIEETQENEFPYGKSLMKQWNFDGIRIIYTRNVFNDRYLFKNHNAGDVVGLEFNLNGRYIIFHQNQTYNVHNHQHNIIYTPGFHNLFKNNDLNTETFKIEFHPNLFLEIIRDSNEILKSFSSQVELNQPVVLSPSSGIIDVQLLNAINEIINCSYQGGIKKTFLLSKCLEILVLQAESFARTENRGNNYNSSKEIEQLQFVRKYLVEHLDMPPSLRELARISGLNEYKLKKGFKNLYNTTVFGYLAGHRLNTAKQRLESERQSIAEIAYDLGYSSPQHFSKAFKERFGLSPKSVRKQ